MRGNEILLILKNKGFEQGVTKVLLDLAEENEELRKANKELVTAFTDLVRVQTMLNGVADTMKSKIDMIMDRGGEGPTRGLLK